MAPLLLTQSERADSKGIASGRPETSAPRREKRTWEKIVWLWGQTKIAWLPHQRHDPESSAVGLIMIKNPCSWRDAVKRKMSHA